MSEITSGAQSSLDSILQELGISRASEGGGPRETKQSLGQEDFLKLMTAQLNNQDPFKPVDNTDFIAQMAQFSTVTGITDINKNLLDLGEKLAPNRVAVASSFIGHEVLVPGSLARPNEYGTIAGAVDVPGTTNALTLVVRDITGEILDQIDMGAAPEGMVGFEWNGFVNNPEFKPRDAYLVEAYAVLDGAYEGASTHVYGRVMSASIPNDSTEDVTLEVEGFGNMSSADVKKIRN
jgi:flagellar basal-body rod modification protein FlgD